MLWQDGLKYLALAFILGIIGGCLHRLLGCLFCRRPGTMAVKWIRDFLFCVASAILLLLMMNQLDSGRFRLAPCLAYAGGWWLFRQQVAPYVDETINMFFTAISKFVIIIKTRIVRRLGNAHRHQNAAKSMADTVNSHSFMRHRYRGNSAGRRSRQGHRQEKRV
ncbi:MAG: spore cortex biosynthesis protein YabQ [Clostridia bacterium]|nr:spore cortex biosynthesis protein YabQ [Clostridia bacterium]